MPCRLTYRLLLTEGLLQGALLLLTLLLAWRSRNLFVEFNESVPILQVRDRRGAPGSCMTRPEPKRLLPSHAATSHTTARTTRMS